MKTIVSSVAFLLVAQTVLAVIHTPVHSSRMDAFNQKTGGLVEPPADGKKLVVLDARIICKAPITNNLKVAARFMEFSYEIKKIVLAKGDCPLKLARQERKGKAGAVLFYCEDDDMPILSIYPEEAITVINVKPLRDKDELTYLRRFHKEFWRGLAFTFGGYGGTQQGQTVLAPVFSLEELDNLRANSIAPTQVNSITVGKNRLRIYGDRPVPYVRACREGWAPAPTNDVQKAIYDRIKNPISRFKRDFCDGEVKNPIVTRKPASADK